MTSGTIIPVAVGSGGTGALIQLNNNVVNNTNGSASSFGAMLIAFMFIRRHDLKCLAQSPGQGCVGGSGRGCSCVQTCCPNTGLHAGSGGSCGSNQRCDLGLNFVYRVCTCIYLIFFVYVSICIYKFSCIFVYFVVS